MKLSISNIAWDSTNENDILDLLKKKNFNAIEIAPTILIKEEPYQNIKKAKKITNDIKKKYKLEISSMQSIWYGKNGNIFNKEDANMFIDYTKLAIDFANAINCKNLVFGCPKNRIIPDGFNKKDIIYFFREIGEYANSNNTTVSIEPNPTIYGTNFINYTNEAFEFCKEINSKGIKVNVDFGTIIQNNENLDEIANNINLINHIHISEPNLAKIKSRKEHLELYKILKESEYDKYISIEMKKTENIKDIIETIEYVKNIFE